jgi:hypothetical protein
MGKEYTIEIRGYGMEVVKAKYTDEEIKKVQDYMDDNDCDLSEIMANSLMDEIIEDRDIYEWYEQDDLGHFHGGEIESCDLVINGEETYIQHLEDDDMIEVEYNVHEVINNENVITTVSLEKGILFGGVIVLEDDEEFDMSKIKLNVDIVGYDDYESSIISSVIYNNKEVGNDDLDTRGTGLQSYIDIKYQNGE